MNATPGLDPVKHFKSVAWTSTERAQIYDRTTSATNATVRVTGHAVKETP